MIARPVPGRPAPGGGLAVLVVVTVLAVLAAPQLGRLRPLVDQLRQVDPPALLHRPTPPSGAAGGVCPVKGPVRIGQGWGAPRDGGRRRHQGIDLLAPAGTPLVAVTSGTITRLSNPDRGRGGISLWLRDARGTAYYYAHNHHNLVRLGQRVRAGQLLARVGATGNAQGGPPHLHFQLHPGGGRPVSPDAVGAAVVPMTLAVWLALAPVRLLAALGLRRSLILACLFVLAVTAYGVAEDLGLLDPPAAATPTRPASQAHPSAAARADIPASYLTLYRRAARAARGCPGRCWPPSGRSSPTTAAAASPGSARAGTRRGRRGRCSSASALGGPATPGPATAPTSTVTAGAVSMTPATPSRPPPATCATHGAPRRLDRALYAYNHSWAYVAKVKAIAARYRTRGGGRR